LYFSYSRSQCAIAPYDGGSGGEAGTRVKLLYAVKMPQEKIQLLCLSTPTSVQHQSIIANVQFIMPSPFVNAEAFLDFFRGGFIFLIFLQIVFSE
jgi:hypothetical protein